MLIRLTFGTLPPEIRQLIYAHLLGDLRIRTGPEDLLDTSEYPSQISAVSHQTRNESLPFFSSGRTTLLCRLGHFSDTTRRRIPRRVLRDVAKIVILDDIAVDEIQPSRRSFPVLQTLEFDLVCYQGFRKYGLIFSRARLDAVELFKACLEQELMRHYDLMTMPREGLERDYLPENTLWDVWGWERRGFEVVARRRTWCDNVDYVTSAAAFVVGFNLDT